jgi:hypothetical protein
MCPKLREQREIHYIRVWRDGKNTILPLNAKGKLVTRIRSTGGAARTFPRPAHVQIAPIVAERPPLEDYFPEGPPAGQPMPFRDGLELNVALDAFPDVLFPPDPPDPFDDWTVTNSWFRETEAASQWLWPAPD